MIPGNDNRIVQLCAKAMGLEATQPKEAIALCMQAWKEAIGDLEKFIAAHYVARHQVTIKEKLSWDEKALQLALNIDDDNIKQYLPSLYLNIAKCYEDLNEFNDAQQNYKRASDYTNYLPDDNYGKMIKSGISAGIKRIVSSTQL